MKDFDKIYMKTYKELFLSIQSLPDPDILQWLSVGKWKGKDKQEALLRLFARLGLLPKINNDFHMCTGNFNLNTIKPQSCFRDIFLSPKHKEVCLNDKGDSSDLTGIHKNNPKHLLVSTSKCIQHLSLKKLDIDYIATNFKQYEEKGYTMTLCIVVKNAEEYRSTLERSERTTAQLKKWIQSHNIIVVDWNDLNDGYRNLKSTYGTISFQDLITVRRSPLVLRMHQKLCCVKTMRWKGTTKKILWGHIQRSGKSYIIGGVIMEDSKDKTKCNYLVMTTAPNETITQYLQVLDSSQFVDFNVVHLDGKSSKPALGDKNIIICSKQFLQSKFDDIQDNQDNHEEKRKPRNIPWLKNMSFDMRFVDESHNGGTTELAHKTLEYYGNESFTVYITATYSKPVQDYNIPRDHWILWDLEDIQLCKNISNNVDNVDNKKVERLVEKHGDDIRILLQQYSMESIRTDFSKYPDLDILTMNISPEVLSEITNETRNNLYGWSLDACFLLKQGVDEMNEMNDMNEVNETKNIVYHTEFQNEKENLKLWQTIFGKRNRFGIPDRDFPDDLVFMKRIEKICKNPTTSSRFIGDLDQNVIMAFLPPHNIDLVSHATQQLLEKENVVPDFDILCINSKTTTDPKQAILDAKTRARNRGKKGVLVLSGRQCSLGVTIDDCDIVLLLNNTNSYDMIFQMMFRCMTEGSGKKRGFVVDPNIHRVVETILIEYGSVVKPTSHPKEAVRYLLEERLINLNSDHWKPCFGHGSSQLTTLANSIYEIYSSRMTGALENLFRRMSLKQELFSKNEYETMRCIFENLHPHHLSRHTKDSLLKELQQHGEGLKKGIKKTSVLTDEDSKDDHLQEEERHINPIDILRPISIVISLLTIHDKDRTTLEEMFFLVDTNEKTKSILIEQVRVWWGKGVSSEDVEGLLRIFSRYLEKDKGTTMLIRQVKELFCKNIKNSRELSKIIDKYLIPQENEKKKNAEVSTPHPLRQEMLDKIPEEFWTQKKKVLEPCCGKGGFLMDIVERFMEGLKEQYPDEKERYKEIVEECLYFSDINDMNIFICRLLLDPYNEYRLKYNEGDTLHLNVLEKWGVEGFEAVVGNPPYQDCNATGDNKLYLSFTKWSHHHLVKKGILLFITPTNIVDYLLVVDKNRGIFDTLQNIQYMAIGTPERFFRVSSTFTYFLLFKEPYSNTTVIEFQDGVDIQKTKITLKEGVLLPKTPSSMVLNILSKITTADNDKRYQFQTFKFGGKCQRIRAQHLKAGIVTSTPTDKNKYPIIDTVNKKYPSGFRYYYHRLDDDVLKNKIVFSKKGYLMPTYDNSHQQTYSDNFVFLPVENDNLLILFTSPIIGFLCKQFSKNGFDLINAVKMLRQVDKIDMDGMSSSSRDVDDVYHEYNLTEEEINYINNVKTEYR